MASEDVEKAQGWGESKDERLGTNVNTVEEATEEDDEGIGGRPACFNSTVSEILFVLTATMAIAMSSWLSGSITVISSFVARDLHMNQAGITWLAAASSLTSGTFLLFFGRAADLFGRKTLFVGSLFLFTIFNLASGFANATVTLDVLQAVAGIFAAAAIPAAVGIVSITYGKPSKRKNLAFACFSGGNPLGFVAGTVFGGIATTLLGWRSNFWLLAIVMFVFTIIGFFVIPKDTTDKKPLNWEAVKHFDIVGTLLTIGGIGMFSAAITLGPDASQEWGTGYVIALLIVGVALMVAFVFWERWFKDPIVPMNIWKDRDFTIGLLILSLGFMSFIPASFFISLFFQEVWHMSSISVAVHILPMAISGIIVNIIAGFTLHRISNKLLMYIGTSSYSLAFLLLALNRTSSSYWSFCFPALCIVVIGADLEFNVVNMYVITSMSRSQQSVAGGIFQTAAKLCMTLGLGIATAILDSVRKKPSLASYWDDAVQPYSAVFWFSFACAFLSILLVPFLTIQTQGGKHGKRTDSVSEETAPSPQSQPVDAEKAEAGDAVDKKDNEDLA